MTAKVKRAIRSERSVWAAFLITGTGASLMLTLDAILKATRQMTTYGERGTPGALDHIPAKVQGQPSERSSHQTAKPADGKGKHARIWDDKKKVYK